MRAKTIPIFFSCDDKYAPFAGIAIYSLLENGSEEYNYDICILSTGLCEEYTSAIKRLERDNAKISFIDVTEQMKKFSCALHLRDYYTAAIYFRIFIPELFPQYDKGIYLDSDMIVTSDISRLFEIDLGDNLIGATRDQVIYSRELFKNYTTLGVGVHYTKYFNSGMLLMNLSQMRSIRLEEQFIDMFNTYHFDVVCPDQDYLNVLCYGKVMLLDIGWNKMSVDTDYDGVPHIIHYNMFNKPWQYDGVPYGEYFWKYAKKTEFYSYALSARSSFTDDDARAQELGDIELCNSMRKIIESDYSFKKIIFDKGVIKV